MFKLFHCLTVEHDWRLVALADAVCFLASMVVVILLHRARATEGWVRLTWLSLDGAVAGYGIWATHFIALLAYNSGVTVRYNIGLTAFSLLVAVLVTGSALAISLSTSSPWAS